MPHKRRRKSAGQPGQRGGGDLPNALSYGPTKSILLTYYKRLDLLTAIIQSSSPPIQHEAILGLRPFTDTIVVCSLSSDTIELGDVSHQPKDECSITDVSC